MKRNNLFTTLIVTVSFLFLVVVSFGVLLFARVKKEYTVDMGQTIEAEEFKRFSWDKGNFIWLEQPDFSSEGEKTGKIQVFPITYTVKVIVKGQDIIITPTEVSPSPVPTEPVIEDTFAPVVTTKKIVIYAEDYINNGVSAEQFIEEITEESEYHIEVLSKPAAEAFGKQSYIFSVKDSFGNDTTVEAELFIINLKKDITAELGNEFPDVSDFLYYKTGEASFVTDVASISVMAEGTHEITMLLDGQEAVSTLHIKDTQPPKLVLLSAETWLNKPLEAATFINYDETSDNSDAFDVAYAVEPDWALEGEQTVKISATDASGNSITQETVMLIKKDAKAPVVTVTDIDVKVGGTVSYKKAVNYFDDIDSKDEMKLSIERSNVNLKEIGTYEVTYTVTDCSGNSTSVTGKINVLNESPKWEDEEAIHEKAQGVLDSILKDGMTDREKARAIYKWIKNNIGYISHSEKGNYTRGAYEGLFKYQGDCFVYASTAKELLTLAGIQNIDIVKATKNPSHYWNLVYIEDGWYHFDSTPRKDKSEFFLLTDAELEEYSSKHKNTHIFDRSLYPEIE